jgi:uncharacterized protein YndB with AHSA1/START domain
MRDGGAPDVAITGEVIEVDPPRKLVQTWHMVMDETVSNEGSTTLTYEITEPREGFSKLTVVHELEGKPTLARLMSGGMEEQGAGGGWPFVLSSLKTLLETGEEVVH